MTAPKKTSLRPGMAAVLAAAVFCGCGALSQKRAEKPPARPASAKAKRELKKITAEGEKKTPEERLAEISLFIDRSENSGLALEAYMIKARLLARMGKKREACQAWQDAAGLPFSYKNHAAAVLPAAACLFKKGKALEAARMLESLMESSSESREGKISAAKLLLDFLSKERGFESRKGAKEQKLLALSHLIKWEPKAAAAAARIKAAEDLTGSLPGKSLLALAERADRFPSLKGHLFYKAGEYLWRRKDTKKARSYFRKALASPIRASLKKEIAGYLKALKSLKKVNPYLIGAVIPLSGRRKPLGQKILRGLSLGLNMEGDSPWQLIVMDSKSHPGAAAEALEKLLYQYHVIGAVGGLSGETAEALAEKASFFGLPAILLSQKSGLSEGRQFVFQNAVASSALMAHLTEEAAASLPLLKRAAVLRPEDPYGEEYARSFSGAFRARGGEIAAELSYKPGEADFKELMKKLLGLSGGDLRQEEYMDLKEALLKKQPGLSPRSKKLRPENLLPPQIDFDGIFIPDSMAALKKIRDHLKYFRVKNVYLIGTNLLKRGQISRWTNDLPLIFIGPPPITNKKARESFFYESYRKMFRAEPGFFERRAYNAGAALRAALSRGPGSRQALQEALTGLGSVQGALRSFEISKERAFLYPLKAYIAGESRPAPLDSPAAAKILSGWEARQAPR